VRGGSGSGEAGIIEWPDAFFDGGGKNQGFVVDAKRRQPAARRIREIRHQCLPVGQNKRQCRDENRPLLGKGDS